ncbi:MAG: PucR family transcriptional regulator [Nocardioidaceae bacterium]
MGNCANDRASSERELSERPVSQGQDLLARGERVHQALVDVVLGGGGLGELMDALHDHVGGLTLATTTDGRLLAHSSERQLELEAVLQHPDICADTGRFRSERFAPGVHQVGPLSLSVAAVLAGSSDHGRLVVVRREGRASAIDHYVLERAARVAALAITKALAVSAVEAKYRGDFVRDVLVGRGGAPDAVAAHFASLGWDVARPLAVVVAALDPLGGDDASREGFRTAQERFANAWVTVVGRHDRSTPVVGFAQEVVALVGVRDHEEARKGVDALVRAVSGDGGGGRRSFSTGVSRIVDVPEMISRGYEQARRAVHVGRQLQGTSAVAHFDDLGAFRLLSLIDDAGELRAFVGEVLHELADYDDAEAADMRTTLRALLDTNVNVAETSRRLHFHYNTLRYRITKLERTVGPFTSDPDLQLDLALALRVLQMRGL